MPGQEHGHVCGEKWVVRKEGRLLQHPALVKDGGEGQWWHCWPSWEAEEEQGWSGEGLWSGQAGGHQVGMSRGQRAEGPSAQEGPLGCGQRREGHGRVMGRKGPGPAPGRLLVVSQRTRALSGTAPACARSPRGNLGLALTPLLTGALGLK